MDEPPFFILEFDMSRFSILAICFSLFLGCASDIPVERAPNDDSQASERTESPESFVPDAPSATGADEAQG